MGHIGVSSVLEGKKNGSASAPEAPLGVASVGDFIGGMKDELSKVTWTSREEMQLYIKVVVLSTLVFGLGVYAVDVIIQGVLHGLNAIVQFIGG
ncbi:MAG: preprotein translocase subunit SecE [Chlamydiales bacterium]|nr:preprotein translocase subunit SecE [Chlamydiales bacterium]